MKKIGFGLVAFVLVCLIAVIVIVMLMTKEQQKRVLMENEERQKQVLMENEYQTGIKYISEGRFSDAVKSLKNLVDHDSMVSKVSRHGYSLPLYFYAKTKVIKATEAGNLHTSDLDYFVDDSYNGPFAEEILALRREVIAFKAKVKEKGEKLDKENLGKSKDKDYLSQLESILMDVKYSSSASDAYRAEQKLRWLRGEMMDDPKITANELKKLDQVIDAVSRMTR